jgi:ABC-type amino acid transport substrate-binding protein
MIRYKKIDLRNLKTHVNLTVGNLYFRPKAKKKKDPVPDYEVVDGFSYEELYDALKENRIEMIWIEGPVLRKVVLE